jgi:hypothetical protein
MNKVRAWLPSSAFFCPGWARDTAPLSLLDSVSLAYQRVQKVDCTSLRPVLLLGPLLDVVKEMLVNEAPGKFCRCPLGKGCPVPTRCVCPYLSTFLAMQSNWHTESKGFPDAYRPTCGPLFSPRKQIVVRVSMLMISCAVCIGPFCLPSTLTSASSHTEVMKASQQAIERGVKDCLFVDYKRRSGHFDVTTVASIKEITEKVPRPLAEGLSSSGSCNPLPWL